jgi:hypothetical protein
MDAALLGMLGEELTERRLRRLVPYLERDRSAVMTDGPLFVRCVNCHAERDMGGAQKGGSMKTRLPSAGDLRRYCDFDPIGLGFLTQRQPDRQHTGLVLGGDLAGVDRGRER